MGKGDEVSEISHADKRAAGICCAENFPTSHSCLVNFSLWCIG